MKNVNVSNEGVRQRSWFGGIIENIVEEESAAMDVHFPLSGGEDGTIIYHKEKPAQNDEQRSKWSSFLDDLETEFPLSGGEIER